MATRITRRHLVALAGALHATAQPPDTPLPIPANPDEERKAVLAQFRLNADTLAKVSLPMSAEPATHFKA
jgi:hypothetical protein